jgi:predicted O-methyltransferase YrrM
MAEETACDLADVLDTVLDVNPGIPPYRIRAMQIRDELQRLAETVSERDVRTVLEIGTAHGGTLYVWARYLDGLSGVVSVDLPGGAFGGGYREEATALFRSFDPATEMAFVRDDSHESSTFERVATIVEDQFESTGVDFLFIDGDHTYEGVKRDFGLYEDLVSDGGMIALHDIVHHPTEEAVVTERRQTVPELDDEHLQWHPNFERCTVDAFWAELQSAYATEELVSHPKQTWAGIGIVYV